MSQTQTIDSQDSLKSTTVDINSQSEYAITYLQVACLGALIIFGILFLILIKISVFKFLGFFILRKDYQRLHLLDA